MPFDYSFRFRKDAISPSPAFPYRKSILRPFIRMKLINGEKSVEVNALIDSGADYCLFDSDLGELIGLEIEKGFKEQTMGVGSQPADVYFHDVELEIRDKRWKVRAGFMKNLSIGALVGREGFFSKFRVTLDQSRAITVLTD